MDRTISLELLQNLEWKDTAVKVRHTCQSQS